MSSLLNRRLKGRTSKRKVLYDRDELLVDCTSGDGDQQQQQVTSSQPQIADQWLVSKRKNLDDDDGGEGAQETRNEPVKQHRDKIFIISASCGSGSGASGLPLRTFLFTSLTITVGLIVCFALSLVANLNPFVQAQLNAAPSNAARQFSEATSQSSRSGAAQATRAPNAHRHNYGSSNGDDDDDDIDSIDRFDLGEQIRAPLLKPPTTLAPSQTTINTRRSDNDDRNTNRRQPASQAAAETASEESTYLSPEEREQLMRSQEAHYGGASGGGPDGPEAGDAAGGSESPQTLQQTASYNRRHQRPGSLRHSDQQRATTNSVNNEAAGSPDQQDDNDDDDYSEGNSGVPNQRDMTGQQNLVPGPHRPSQNSAMRVPETRRSLSMANSRLAPLTNNNNQLDDADSVEQPNNDDYSGGANEDAYFSRRPSNQNTGSHGAHGNQLNLAASNNRQQKEMMMLARERQRQNALDNRRAGAEMQENLDAPSMGDANSGPALSGRMQNDGRRNGGTGAGQEGGYRPRMDQEARGNQLDGGSGEPDDDDDDMAGGEGGSGSGADDSDAPRSAMNEDLNGGNQADSGGPAQADPSANPDNYAAAASSSHTKPTSITGSQHQRQVESMRQPTPIGRLHPAHPAPIRANTTSQLDKPNPNGQAAPQIRQQAADQWHQVRLAKNPHLQLQATTTGHEQRDQRHSNNRQQAPPPMVLSAHNQQTNKPTATSSGQQEAYNPQLNPSHAGKYFIY